MTTRGAVRGWDEVMVDAIRVLTEAGRIRRPVPDSFAGVGGDPDRSERTAPADWAEFVTLAVAGAAANLGGVERALGGRSGSWEADSVRTMLLSTVGTDPAGLQRHRTEPLQLVLRPAEILEDLGYDVVYDESQRVLNEQQLQHVWRYELDEDRVWRSLDPEAPAYTPSKDDPHHSPYTVMEVPRSDQDDREHERLLELEIRAEDLRYRGDPRAYGEALRSAVQDRAADLMPGVDVEVDVDLEERGGGGFEEGFYGPAEQLLETLRLDTPLPWSGIAPKDYPLTPGEIVDVERAAGRLPHQRVSHSDTYRAD